MSTGLKDGINIHIDSSMYIRLTTTLNLQIEIILTCSGSIFPKCTTCFYRNLKKKNRLIFNKNNIYKPNTIYFLAKENRVYSNKNPMFQMSGGKTLRNISKTEFQQTLMTPQKMARLIHQCTHHRSSPNRSAKLQYYFFCLHMQMSEMKE